MYPDLFPTPETSAPATSQSTVPSAFPPFPPRWDANAGRSKNTGAAGPIEGADEQLTEVCPGRDDGAVPRKDHPSEIVGTHCDHGMGLEPDPLLRFHFSLKADRGTGSIRLKPFLGKIIIGQA